MSLKALQQRKADLIAEGDRIFNKTGPNTSLTEDDLKRDQEIQAELEEIETQIAAHRRHLDRQRDAPPVDEPNAAAQRRSESNGRKFQTLGEQLLAVMRVDDPDDGAVDPRLRGMRAATGLSEGVPADGGFLVQQDFIPDLIRPMYEVGELLRRVRRIPISANANGLKMNAINETSRANGSRWGGVQAYWTAEAGLKTPSMPQFRVMELSLKKLAALCYATDELLQDAVALEAIIREAFETEMIYTVEDAIVNGGGVGMPLGFMNSGAVVTVPKVTGQTAATIVAENLYAMWARLPARSKRNAVWLINGDASTQFFGLKDAAGNSVYMPAGGLSVNPYETLLGRPVISTEYNAALGTAGDIILVDLSQYLLIDKGGIDRAQSIHVRFIYDETAFRFVYRVDGQPLWNSTVTPRNSSLAQSAFVTLATRA